MAKKLKLDETLSKADSNDELASSEAYVNDCGREPLLLDPKRDDLVFQATDFRDCESNEGNQLVDIYGVSKDGFPVMVTLDDFYPYFYIPVPEGFTVDDCAALKKRMSGAGVYNVTLHSKHVGTTMSAPRPLLKIMVERPSRMEAAREALLAAEAQARGLPHTHFKLETYGYTIPFLSRFMADMKTSPMTWLRIPAGQYQITDLKDKVSTLRVEACASVEDLKPLSDGERQRLGLPVDAPRRVLSFDIETMVPADNSFPHPEKESVIQISSVVACRSSMTDKQDPFFSCVFTLGTCADIPGCTIFSFKTEEELLTEWRRFVVAMDPDVVMGHNILRFDLPYLLHRAKALDLEDFPFLGRLADIATTFDHPFSDPDPDPNRRRNGWAIAPSIPGRIIIDSMHWALFKIFGRQSRSLNALARLYLGEGKDDVHYTEIVGLQTGTAETRKRLAKYCLQDALLVLKLTDYRGCVQAFYVPGARQSLLTLNSVVSTVDFNHLSNLKRWKAAEGRYMIGDT